MKLNSGWVAAGLLLFVILACNVTKNSNTENSSNKNSSSSSSDRSSKADVYIDQISMAKDDDGKPGDSTSSFAPDERTVHTVVVLNKAKEGTTIKWVWVAVDAGGFPKNYEIKSAEYTTGPNDTNVHGHLTWSRDWPTGDYRAEVYLNGVLDKTVKYSVR
jgi:hypothetical protein